MDCTIYVAKTKALISCPVTVAVTAQLICAFVFAYAKSRFSHDPEACSATDNIESLEILDVAQEVSFYLGGEQQRNCIQPAQIHS